MAKASEINAASEKQKALECFRELPRDLMEGLPRLKEQAKAAVYLPRNPTEVPVNVPGFGVVDPWWNRVSMSRLNNMFRDAVEDAAGRAFAKPAQPDEKTPKDLVSFLDDVDGQGSNFQVFGKEVAETSIAEGEDFVLVDFPPAPDGMRTAEQEAAMHLAPFWRRYSPANVLDWKIGARGRESRVEMVKLREMDEGMLQVRILNAGNPELEADNEARWTRFEVWRPVDQGKPESEWALFSFGNMKPQTEIPLVEFPSDLAPPFCAKPPYSDLAWLTIAHYRKTSDLDNAQHAVGFPILFVAGMRAEEGGPIPIGSTRAFFAGDPAASATFVEPAGTAWESLSLALQSMEAQGKQLSAEPLVTEASANMTATDAMIRAAGATSKLESWVIGWEDSFARLFRFTAIYLGIVKPEATSGWGSISLNDQFIPLGRNVEGARIALDANVAGKLSDETLHEVLIAAEIVPETVDYETDKQRRSEDGPDEPSAEDKAGEDLTGADAEKAA